MLGKPLGKVSKCSTPRQSPPLADNPSEYPRALATGTATALPT